MDNTIQEEIEKFISTAWEQLTNESSSPSSNDTNQPEIYFTRQFFHTAQNHDLTQEDALDVYHYGEPAEEGKLVREYQEYELGITYFIDSQNGNTVITSIWKQTIVAK